jgi:hypothetical protein
MKRIAMQVAPMSKVGLHPVARLGGKEDFQRPVGF